MTTRFARWTAALAVAGLLFAACTSVVDTEKVQNEIKDGLSEQGLSDATVECPEDVEATEGATFTCDASSPDGTTAVIEVTMTDDEGTAEWTVVESSGGDSGGGDVASLEADIKTQLEAQRPELGSLEITCPQDATIGTAFSCTLTADDGSTAEVQVDEEGNFEVVAAG